SSQEARGCSPASTSRTAIRAAWRGRSRWAKRVPHGVRCRNELEKLIEDQADNSNNRFEVASTLNGRLGPPGPFWACPSRAETPALLARKSEYPHQTPTGIELAEYRVVDQHLRDTGRLVQSPWKLFTAGSVGSQALLGILTWHGL